MAMQTGRNIRHYANKFSHPARASSGERFYMGSRPYSSARTPLENFAEAVNTVTLIPGTLFSFCFLYCFGTTGFFRRKYEEWKSEKYVQEMLEKLESKEHESAEAYLVELDRRADALRAKLFNRPADVSNMSFSKSRVEMIHLNIVISEIETFKARFFSRGIDAMKEKHQESFGSSPPEKFSHRKLFATVLPDNSRITRDGQQQ